jgi:hypothetical protein
MPTIIDGKDRAVRFDDDGDYEPNHEVHVTTEGILNGLKQLNEQQAFKELYDALLVPDDEGQGGHTREG